MKDYKLITLIIKLASKFFWPILLLVLALLKPYIAKRVLKKSQSKDPMWNEDTLKHIAEKAFLLVHESLAKRDSAIVGDYVTDHMFMFHERDINELISNHEIYKYSSINITKIVVIGVEDYKENNDDTFSVRITGSMISYTTDENNGEYINNSPNNIKQFNNILEFVRDGNSWYLHKIYEDCVMDDVAITANHLEE
jgi:predicted lipid-binding transport protein (Tim44 family)